ncbi:glycosyltransferase family 25 protein [Sutterella sp. KLE1602]|uniref:glycosyltransferase family 25 protein n=1 Tax=Sutterella sp. KLE1602 TaxID=1574262 RepID=UPI0018D3B6B9|nr:glycosyltransferase family 25 protein [Sutterella sp. KLE1602]
MLVTYVINLKRSTERMENMDRALKAMQVDYERVEGVDAQLLSEVLLSRNATPSVEYPYELTKGELACSSAIGASAYLISRGAAVEALRMSARISEPADNFLFGPWSEFSRKVPCWRLLGGVVRRRHGIKTTIAGRNVRRKFYLTKRLSLKRLARKMQMALQKRHLQETVQYWLE